MENKALEILREMLGRRGLDTKTDRVTSEDLERVNMFTIGDILVIFSQKDKGLVERDIRNFVAFAEGNEFKNGLIIVSMSKPSENVLKVVKSFSKERVQFFWIWHLQNDWTTHRFWIPHYIWNEKTKSKFPYALSEYEKKKIVKPEEELPLIDSQDPPIKYLGAVPGDIVLIVRQSDTTGESYYWRYCVEDANVA